MFIDMDALGYHDLGQQPSCQPRLLYSQDNLHSLLASLNSALCILQRILLMPWSSCSSRGDSNSPYATLKVEKGCHRGGPDSQPDVPHNGHYISPLNGPQLRNTGSQFRKSCPCWRGLIHTEQTHRHQCLNNHKANLLFIFLAAIHVCHPGCTLKCTISALTPQGFHNHWVSI
jgi:hypothetical protein